MSSNSVLNKSNASQNSQQQVSKPNITTSTTIPINRIRTIMKSSPEITNISVETLQCVAKATEQFIQTLTRESYKKVTTKKELYYNDLANLVAKDDRFQFLSEIVPYKIKLKDALRLIEADKKSQK